MPAKLTQIILHAFLWVAGIQIVDKLGIDLSDPDFYIGPVLMIGVFALFVGLPWYTGREDMKQKVSDRLGTGMSKPDIARDLDISQESLKGYLPKSIKEVQEEK